MDLHRRLIKLSTEKGILYSLVVLTGIIASGLVVIQSWQLSRVVDQVFLRHASLIEVLSLLKLILIVIFFRALSTFLNGWLAGSLAEKIKHEVRQSLLLKINKLGPIWLKNQKTGEVSATLLQGVDALDSYFSQFLPQVILAGVLPLVILFVVFPLDLLTGIIFLVTAPLIPVFMVLIGRMAESVTRKQWSRLQQMGDFLLDSIRGLKTLLLLGRTQDRLDEIKKVSDHYRVRTLNVLKVTFLSAFTLELVATIATAVVAVEIGLRLLYGQIDFQHAFFILLLAPEFYLPMRNLSMRYHAGIAGVTAAASIYKVLDIPEEAARRFSVQHSIPPDLTGKILEFHEVGFSYDRSEFDALKGVSFTFQPGGKYVIVGENGAGKTTMFNLLMQFIQPTEGWIALSGENISMWEPRIWQRSISWLGQKPMIFNTTLMENTRLFDPAYTERHVKNALELAGLGELLQNLPLGLRTPLLELGERFSSGERQKMAIARAFLKNGSIILLDEPASHLDVLSDRDISIALKKLTENCTTIAIAHHASSLHLADEILLLKNGKLVQSGKFDELLNRDEYFKYLLKTEGD
jgi:ATP-binding cassette subfamily C protein CydD